MPDAWLLRDFDASGFGANIFEGTDREVGNTFWPQTDARARRIRWYRGGTTPAQHPDLWRIWDTVTGTVVWSSSAIPDNGAVGWQAAAIPEVPVLLANRRYIVAMQWTTERAYTQFTTGTIPPAPFPGAFGVPIGVFSPGAVPGIPTSFQNNGIYGIDVELRSQQRPLTWTLVDSTPYSEQLKWPVPANGYRLNVTTIPAWTAPRLVAGEDIRRVLGAWQSISDGYKSERRLIDAPQSDLRLPGLALMDGLLLDTGPGSAGTVEAYTVDDAS